MNDRLYDPLILEQVLRTLSDLDLFHADALPRPSSADDEEAWESFFDTVFPDAPLNLNPGTLGNPSRPVLQAMARAGRSNARMLPLERLARMREVREGVRNAAALLWRSSPEDLALGPGTSAYMSALTLALAARCKNDGSQQEASTRTLRLMTTDFEHYGGAGGFILHPAFEIIPLRRKALHEPSAFQALLEETRPEVFFVSQIGWTGHERLPIERWIKQLRVRSPQTIIIVDAAQAIGIEAPVLEGVDFVVASAHKWLCGPAGIGFLWSSASARSRLGSIFPAGDPLEGLHPCAGLEPRGGLDSVLLEGLGAALGLHLFLGPERIGKRSTFLLDRLERQLCTLFDTAPSENPPALDPHSLSTPFPTAPGVLCLNYEDSDPYPIYRALMEEGIAVKCIKTKLKDGTGICRLRIGVPFYETRRRLERMTQTFARLMETHGRPRGRIEVRRGGCR